MATKQGNPPSSGGQISLPQAMNLASEHQAAGRLAEAENILRQILNVAPQHGPATHLLGVVAHQAGQLETAVQLISTAIEQNPNIGLFHTNLCEMLRQSGRLDEAVSAGRRGAELDPQSATAHSNLGVALFDREDYGAAEQSQKKALELAPNLPQALNNLGSICRRREDKEGAADYYRRVLEVAPNHLESLNNLGAVLTELSRPEAAREHLLRAVQIKPDYAEAHRNIGTMFLQQEDFEKAEIAFKETLKYKPDFSEALIGLATIHRENDNLPEAREMLERALNIEPDKPIVHTQLALQWSDEGFPERALESFDRALELDPESESALVGKGHFLTEFGDLDGAEVALDTALEYHPGSTSARLAKVQLKKVSQDDDVVVALNAELNDLPREAITRRLPIHFGLGKCHDDRGEYELAMQHYLEGCRMKRARIEYDAEANRAAFEQITQTFDGAMLARLSQQGAESDCPIFVLGMPRSGTTLTEQIIASHSRVHGAGELPDLLQIASRSPLTGQRVGFPASMVNLTGGELRQLGARYVDGLTARNPQAKHITDKMPANFQALGLIYLMLPNARIVHVKRDPVDTCVSNISKMFKQGQNHTYDLRELGLYYRDYVELMAHWRSALPESAFFEIQYEDLVADTETYARALLDYCGLEWEAGVLDFHKTERSIRTASVTQVRQPIYKSSVAKWKRYEQSLEPLLEALGDLVVQ